MASPSNQNSNSSDVSDVLQSKEGVMQFNGIHSHQVPNEDTLVLMHHQRKSINT